MWKALNVARGTEDVHIVAFSRKFLVFSTPLQVANMCRTQEFVDGTRVWKR